MKKYSIIIAILLYGIWELNGQDDPLWLIKDGLGKSGYQANANEYTGLNSIDSVFRLEGVAHPNRACDPKAKNELLIIYEDGRCLNSREYTYPYSPDFFYPNPATPVLLASTSHSFKIKNNTIKYLYLTGKYEGDDPPADTRAFSGLSQNPNPIYALDYTSTPLISANHDVAMGKDVTLIINSSLLKKAAYTTGSTYYFLKYDSLEVISTRNKVRPISTFLPQLVFNGSHSFPSNATSIISYPSGQFIKVEPAYAPNNIFINLRPGTGLFPYFPSQQNGVVNYSALFELYKSNYDGTSLEKPAVVTFERIEMLSERMVSSHDPNFIRLDSTCVVNGKKFAYYHAEFMNSGFAAAGNLKFEMVFPNHFLMTRVHVSKWEIGGKPTGGSVKICDHKITFEYPSQIQVPGCDSSGRSNCIGILEFCIGIDETINLTDAGVVLKPEASVFFDNTPYPIQSFYEEIHANEFNTANGQARFIRPDPVSSCSCETNLLCLNCWFCTTYTNAMIATLLVIGVLIFILFIRYKLRK